MAGNRKDTGKNGKEPRMGMDEMQVYVETLGTQMYLMSNAIDSIMETRALNVLSGRKGFNVEEGIAEKAGKCGICGEAVEIGDYARFLMVLDKKHSKDGYPTMTAHPFHDACATRALLYMFPQALLTRVTAMGIFDDDTADAICDPEARKELIEELLDYYYSECQGDDSDCDCEDCI
ncbi:MAG: hypothetical protein GX224_00280 [Thermoplasmatales archaeon]|nr:hypothetical protein [Thermoplasmatales archaeon]